MTPEQTVAVVVGGLAFAGVVKLHWNLISSFNFPPGVAGNTLSEVEYSFKRRFVWWRCLLVGLVAPLLAAALAYIVAVGIREVVFG